MKCEIEFGSLSQFRRVSHPIVNRMELADGGIIDGFEQKVAEIDLDQATKPLNVEKAFRRYVDGEGEEIHQRLLATVGNHRADLLAAFDNAIGLQDADRLAHRVAAGAEHGGKLGFRRQGVSKTEIALAHQPPQRVDDVIDCGPFILDVSSLRHRHSSVGEIILLVNKGCQATQHHRLFPFRRYFDRQMEGCRMESCWRWFGPKDLVPLSHARQAGATGIVTALHEVSHSRVWTPAEIEARKALIEAAGLRWSVCESIPVPNAIKLGGAGAKAAIGVWKDSLANLARSGIRTICYNFMPVVDWTRTDLRFAMPTTALALRFDMVEFVAYDVFVLGRRGAEGNYAPELVRRAEERLKGFTPEAVQTLENNIIAGLPGGEDSYGREAIRSAIALFDGMAADDLQANLDAFLQEVVPVAAELGARLAIHPDDPPISLFGLPRVVSTAADLRRILGCVDDPANGLTLCVGSLGSRADNDVLAIAREFAARINFAHLRDVAIEADGSFVEASHLEGRSDMFAILRVLLAEEARRRGEGREDHLIPMRPDHGHLIGDDINKPTNPGYSLIGRLKGLGELHGIIHAIGKAGF